MAESLTRRQSTARRRERVDPRKIAIIAVDGIHRPFERPYPKEVALAFCSDRQGMSWLVEPETAWYGRPRHGPKQTYESGLRPADVASELIENCAGLELYAEVQAATTSWLERLFGACDLTLRLCVGDIHALLPSIGPGAKPAAASAVQRAAWEANMQFPNSGRAAEEAARQAHFVRLLAHAS